MVVVRYFGGILLGVPGLIRAYRSAAADALDKVAVCTKTASRRWELRFGYGQMPALMTALKAAGLELLTRDFSDTCRATLDVPLSKEESFLETMEKNGIFINKLTQP